MSKRKKRPRDGAGRRCLIVERHAWETGFAKEQIQIPLDIAAKFFGPGDRPRKITVRLADAPSFSCECSISKVYKNSTRRVNKLPYLGLLGHCFVLFEETDQTNVYDLWCEYDVAIVAARFENWTQARLSQHKRGRLAIIVPGGLGRSITSLT